MLSTNSCSNNNTIRIIIIKLKTLRAVEHVAKKPHVSISYSSCALWTPLIFGCFIDDVKPELIPYSIWNKKLTFRRMSIQYNLC
jgi:hypothetical protein